MKTPEEMYYEWRQAFGESLDERMCQGETIGHQLLHRELGKETFLAGYKAGREMSNKEIFDYYLELRKKHGQQEPEHKPIVEKFSLTLIEKKGFF